MNSAENIKQLLMQDIDSLIVQPELYAKDGSGFNLFRVPHNPETFRPPNGQSKLGYSEIYVVSAYRLLDKVFTDAVIRPSRIKNEYTAICGNDRRCDKTYGTPLFPANRGFPSYNCFAHAEENKAAYLIRAKDEYVNRLLLDEKPDSDEFDVSVDRIIVRHKAKKSISIRNLLTNTVM